MIESHEDLKYFYECLKAKGRGDAWFFLLDNSTRNKYWPVFTGDENLTKYLKIFFDWLANPLNDPPDKISVDIELRGRDRKKNLIKAYAYVLPFLLMTAHERTAAINSQAIDLRGTLRKLEKLQKHLYKEFRVRPDENGGLELLASDLDTRLAWDFIGEKIAYELEMKIKFLKQEMQGCNPYGKDMRDKAILRIRIQRLDRLIEDSLPIKNRRALAWYQLFKILQVDGYSYASFSGANPEIGRIKKTLLK